MRKVLILIGPTRTSTTSLFRGLADVQGLSPSKIKETNYFLSDEVDLLSDLQFLESFQSMFSKDNDGDCFIEASPLYFLHHWKVIPRINRLVELGYDVKCVVTLREPEERFWSLYKHIISKRSINVHQDVNVFVKANIRALDEPSKASVDLDYLSLYESCYSKILPTWLCSDFDVELCYLDNLMAGQDTVIESVLRWADIELGAWKYLEENKSTLVKNQNLHKISLSINDKFEPFLNRHKWVRDLIRRAYYLLNGRNANTIEGLEVESRQRVRQLLESDTKSLGEFLKSVGKSAPPWCES